MNWYRDYNYKTNDDELLPYLSSSIKPVFAEDFKVQKRSWLKMARLSLFLSTSTVADKLKVSRAAYSKLEESECKGAATLLSMTRAAEAMNCEFVYAIRPKSKIPFSKVIWHVLYQQAIQHPWLKKCDQNRRGNALAYVARGLMSNAAFCKKQSWSRFANKHNESQE